MLSRLRRLLATAGSPSAGGAATVEAAVPVPVLVAAEPTSNTPADGVPWGLRVSAAWAWRFLLVAAATALLLWLFVQLAVVLVPVVLGLLITAIAAPMADRLTKWGLPRAAATAVVVLGGMIVLGGLIAIIAQQISSGFDDLQKSFTQSTEQIRDWLADLGVSAKQVSDFFDQIKETATAGNESLGTSVLQATTTAGHVIAGVFIILFVVIFFVNDGRGIWSWLVGLLPPPARDAADGSGQRAWAVLTSYVRATVIIAAVDAIGIGAGALALRLPFVLPIMVLVFLGAFVPVVGAAISGTAAVAVALVTHGPLAALIMLAIVVGVQQLESHILQPFLMGRMVRVHPLAVVLVIAVGGLTAGIFGALIAVPLAAVVNSVGLYLSDRRRALDVAADAGAATDVPARLH